MRPHKAFLLVPTLVLVGLSCSDDGAPSNDPCLGVSCSGHGACVAEGAEPFCQCDPGFSAFGLECLPGEPDGDADSEGDSDGDGDSDSDTDSDGDSDGSGDADGDADSDGDADTDSDGDADSDVDCDIDADADGDVEVPDCDTDPGSGCVTRVPCGVETIQAALDASGDGDVICVFPGTYCENVTFPGHEVHLRGVGGPTLTTIDGGEAGRVVTIVGLAASDSSLEGFTITNGDAALAAVHSDVGGGILVEGSSVELRRLHVTKNAAMVGGGLFFGGLASGVLEHSRVVANNASKEGGGMAIEGAAPLVQNVLFLENSAVEFGGGLAVRESTLTGTKAINHVRFVSNRAGSVSGGALAARSEAIISMTNVIMAANDADYVGGGVDLDWHAVLTLVNATLVENRAGTAGAGIRVSASATLHLRNVTVSGGVAEESGVRCDTTEGGDHRYEWSCSHSSVSGFTEDYSACILGDPFDVVECDSREPAFVLVDWGSPLDWDLHLTSASSLVGSGEEGITDPDGSRSDIGAYGGPGADEWDIDGDGCFEWWQPDCCPGAPWDCDDLDPLVPGEGCGA
jgi:hypothetical protein